MSKKKERIREVDVAANLVAWLNENGWEVYQEVPIRYSRIVDIVAVKRDPNIAWLIEVKTSVNYQLYRQALDCHYSSPIVSVAVPHPSRFTEARKEFISKLQKNGIGFLHVRKDGTVDVISEPSPEVREHHYRTAQVTIDDLLNLPEEYKTFCKAGSTGGYLTAFGITCMNIVDYVKAHPGCTLREAVQDVDHHYASDNGAVSTLNSLCGVLEKKFGIIFREQLYVEDDDLAT